MKGRMLRAALGLLVIAIYLYAFGPIGAAKPPKPSPSPAPSPSPSPAPSGCSDVFTHLTSGGKLAMTGSAMTAPIAPSPDTTVVVFIGLAGTFPDRVAPAPTLAGGGVTWTSLGTFYKKDGAPRDESAFTALGVQPGPLTIGGVPVGKTHIVWSVVAGGYGILSVTANGVGGLETSHEVTLDHEPAGPVVTGFFVGQQGVVSPVAPALELGQGHTSFVTAFSEWGTQQSAAVTWGQAGHSIGIAVEAAPCEAGA